MPTQTEASTVDRGAQVSTLSPRDLVRLEDKLKQKSEIIDKKNDYISWLSALKLHLPVLYIYYLQLEPDTYSEGN